MKKDVKRLVKEGLLLPEPLARTVVQQHVVAAPERRDAHADVVLDDRGVPATADRFRIYTAQVVSCTAWVATE